MVNYCVIQPVKKLHKLPVTAKKERNVMMTLRQFSAEPSTIPTIASWYIADLSKAQGNKKEP